MSNYLRNRPFLLVKISIQPAKGVDTRVKGWQDNEDSISTVEKVEIVDRVSNKQMMESVVIIDITNSSIVQNKSGKSDDILLASYMSKYKQDILKAITIWAKREAGRMAQVSE